MVYVMTMPKIVSAKQITCQKLINVYMLLSHKKAQVPNSKFLFTLDRAFPPLLDQLWFGEARLLIRPIWWHKSIVNVFIEFEAKQVTHPHQYQLCYAFLFKQTWYYYETQFSIVCHLSGFASEASTKSSMVGLRKMLSDFFTVYNGSEGGQRFLCMYLWYYNHAFRYIFLFRVSYMATQKRSRLEIYSELSWSVRHE